MPHYFACKNKTELPRFQFTKMCIFQSQISISLQEHGCTGQHYKVNQTAAMQLQFGLVLSSILKFLQILCTTMNWFTECMYSPMHRDAEDLLHCREDLGHFFRAPVSSMLRNDNGLLDFCNSSISIELTICAIICVTGTTKVDNSFSEKHGTLRSETTV